MAQKIYDKLIKLIEEVKPPRHRKKLIFFKNVLKIAKKKSVYLSKDLNCVHFFYYCWSFDRLMPVVYIAGDDRSKWKKYATVFWRVLWHLDHFSVNWSYSPVISATYFLKMCLLWFMFNFVADCYCYDIATYVVLYCKWVIECVCVFVCAASSN